MMDLGTTLERPTLLLPLCEICVVQYSTVQYDTESRTTDVPSTCADPCRCAEPSTPPSTCDEPHQEEGAPLERFVSQLCPL